MDTTMESSLSFPERREASKFHIGKRTKKVIAMAVSVLLTAALSLAVWFHNRYAVSDVMGIALKELTQAEYPENPADRSLNYGRYANRSLQLIKRDATHFDFIVKPTNSHTATITFKNVDVSLMVTSEPEWTRSNPDLETIALTDREWNRQQVHFSRELGDVEVAGGNGFEVQNLFSADIANNCLNAGLWEMLLYTKEDGNKKLYYQAWFTFPLGHYKTLFEANTGRSYWKNWRRLEHWKDPRGTPIALNELREVRMEREVAATFLANEPIFAFGDQKGKLRTMIASNLLTWKDFYKGNSIQFATFTPPGRYAVSMPWKNEYWRMAKYQKAILRDIKSPGSSKLLKELELVYEDGKTHAPTRILISGFDVNEIPQIRIEDYPKSFYMPMGIGVPPFMQKYEELKKNPPQKSPYFSMVLDGESHWINHHDMAVDGPVMHRDVENPNILHVYLLSYERHSLITHFRVPLS